MKLGTFLKDKIMHILYIIIVVSVIWNLGYVFGVPKQYMIMVSGVIVLFVGLAYIIEYNKKSKFYNDLFAKLGQLEQKYLISEMLEEAQFLEGRILQETFYDINKSMIERINDIENSSIEFREYIEMWIHEVKLPISAMRLMNYNENWDSNRQMHQIQKLNYYVEQILFYSRMDNAHKDFMLKETELETIINKVIINCKEILINNSIAIEKNNVDLQIITDGKWLEFIIGQIVNNSIKYMNNEGNKISFTTIDKQEKVQLVIEDKGIGISETDIHRVFDKTFTGENGRKVAASTGMGLYICKRLCDKLGHKVWIESQVNEYTKVYLEFGKNNFYLH